MIGQLILGIYFLTHGEPAYSALFFVLCFINFIRVTIKVGLEIANR